MDTCRSISTASGIKKRTLNKVALQRVAGLPVNSEIPLIGMVQRMDEQKGIDILVQAIEPILQETRAQFVILGRGQPHYENMLRQVCFPFPPASSRLYGF